MLESTLEPRTFWDAATFILEPRSDDFWAAAAVYLSFYGIPSFIRLFYDDEFFEQAQEERTNNHHTQRVMYKYIYIYISLFIILSAQLTVLQNNTFDKITTGDATGGQQEEPGWRSQLLQVEPIKVRREVGKFDRHSRVWGSRRADPEVNLLRHNVRTVRNNNISTESVNFLWCCRS